MSAVSTTLGRHGGPLVEMDRGFVELSVYETGVPPRFRLYFLDAARTPTIPPEGVELETLRPNGARQRFVFRLREGYLEATSMLPEPHEFEVVLTVQRGGERKTYEAQFTEADHSHADAAGGHGGRDHAQGHGHGGAHGHMHGVVDPGIATSARGLWAVKWSFVGLFTTASLQLVVVLLSHSVALMADMIHNFADAGTAVPLAIAFLFSRRPPSRRYTYGFGRVEDLAGLAVVLTITASAAVAAYVAIQRLLHPQAVSHLLAIMAASIIGFIGNEAVAVFRIRVGKEIGSAALVADGYHARTDGWTSLAVLAGAIGVHFGYPLADPIIGLVITVAIIGIVWQSVRIVFSRMLDGVDPEVIDQMRSIAGDVGGVTAVADVRARWIGHQIRAELNLAVSADLTVVQAHQITKEVEHELLHNLQFLAGATIHVDPTTEAGEGRHLRGPHALGDVPMHGH